MSRFLCKGGERGRVGGEGKEEEVFSLRGTTVFGEGRGANRGLSLLLSSRDREK